jgi:hypothetical protein
MPAFPPVPNVNAYLVRVAALENATRKRIANTRASCAEGAQLAEQTLRVLRASMEVLRGLQVPHTIDAPLDVGAASTASGSRDTGPREGGSPR